MAKKDTDKSKPTDREKKYQKKVAQERKKLEKIISFPAKAIFLISLIISLIVFLYAYFNQTGDLIAAVLTSFFWFSASFIGFGITMILFFFFKSEQIKNEYNQQLYNEKREKEHEEQTRYKSELSELENIERELYEKRTKQSPTKQIQSPEAPQQQSARSLSDEEAYLEEVLNSNFKP